MVADLVGCVFHCSEMFSDCAFRFRAFGEGAEGGPNKVHAPYSYWENTVGSAEGTKIIWVAFLDVPLSFNREL